MRNKVVDLENLRPFFHDGMTIMVPGFSRVGIPVTILHAIAEWGISNLRVITSSTGFTELGPGMLVEKGLVSHYTAPFIGTNREVVRHYTEKITSMDLIPMGTLCERIRAAAFGLGGILTPTGVGTMLAEGKEVIVVDEKEYLLEKPLHADLAILRAYQADPAGSLTYKFTAKNTNPIMAMAADAAIAEADEIVPAGTLDPNQVITPAYLVQAVIQTDPKYLGV